MNHGRSIFTVIRIVPPTNVHSYKMCHSRKSQVGGVLLATVVVHVWCHFLGLYLHLSVDRLTRSAFLSGRNAVEAEHAAEHQSNRLNRLLAAFLPQHLITAARLQIATSNPHIYAEHYPQVTVAYGRLIGFEAVLSQCSSLDAARVLK
ncbi:hypothetical protein TELCIR_16289, partial [Teladorsagia circumcincta]